jgi:RHS repeat-associated protein
LHRDYQGSIVAITNQAGAVVEKRLYDAWGEVVRVQDGQGTVLNGFKVLDRGYTGHEHLHSVGLIHMNGRLYDPKLHRFLQPDNYIQDPYNTQNYNRYAYVLNNPLKYTDPSGEVIEFGAAVLIGAFIAATTYTLTALLADVPFTPEGFLKATIIGAASAAVTFGIGTGTSTIGNFYVRATVQAFSHGTFQGGMSEVQGGKFITGFASGSLSSIVSSAFSGGSSYDANGNAIAGSGWGGAGSFAQSNIGMVAFGTVMGGAGASLTGGNFWQGAASGLVVSGLNHAMHKMSDDSEIDPPTKKKLNAKSQENDTFKKISDALGAIGLGTDAKMMILNMAKGNLTAVSGYLKGMNFLSGALGVGAIGVAAYQYVQSPTTSNLLSLVGTSATVLLAGPAGGFIVGLLDVTGVSTNIYNFLGTAIDNLAGYSVGQAVYNNTASFFNQLQINKQ